MKEKIYQFLPGFLQSLLITIYNYKAYKKRYGGNYKNFYNRYKKLEKIPIDELLDIQSQKYSDFIQNSMSKSSFYKNSLEGIKNVTDLKNINKLPIIDKEILRSNIENIYTVKKGVISKTGGTTGKSLKVIYTKSNVQERFAMLDLFRKDKGYELGKKTAWFSGKNILTKKDVNRFVFWKTDYFYKVRYYSTFHIKDNYLEYYINNLKKYKPEFFVGFPSTIYEIAKYGKEQGIEYPKGTLKAVFPTAETVTQEMRFVIEEYFGTDIYNQYGSSEGAPLIFECKNKKLHIELMSGVFEVLNNENEPSDEGRLVLTSFATEGTPLIRYDIGDRLKMSYENNCKCGNNNPIVSEILGRVDDYIYSPENGKINLGNISNTLKDVEGVKKFQVVQNKLNTLEIYLIKDDEKYSKKSEDILLKNWRDRVGDKMNLNLNYVGSLKIEKSGKFRLVKNNIKEQLNVNSKIK